MQTLFSRHQQQLATLTEQLNERRRIRDLLAPYLTEKAQQALLDASVQAGKLHLLTTNASWASRLRLSARQLIGACSHLGVTELSVHLAAQTTEQQRQTTKTVIRSVPTETDLASLTTFSQQLNPKDELTQALQKLIQQLSAKTIS